MSGHSKWKTNKSRKTAADAKKGAVYTKLIKEITAIAREGGGDPDTNARLRAVMQKAKEANMPSDNVKTAIKRGTGELPGVSYEEVVYEGYGPAGVAIMVETLTDNKNRTSAEVRNIFSKKGGNLAGAGSVSWMFNTKGFIVIDTSKVKEEQLLDIVLEAGAEDMKVEGDTYEVITQPKDLENVKGAISKHNIEWQSAEIMKIPSSSVKVASEQNAKSLLALIDALEEQEDVQNVYSNFDIPDELLVNTE